MNDALSSEGARGPGSGLHIVAAGAGTGKTHRLAEELKSALLHAHEPVAPESVVAVTFTRVAAAELEERVRRALLQAGRPDLAHRLAGARIGTVHGVCARLVQEHAFALGLSPQLLTLDERVARQSFAAALAAVIDEEERAGLDALLERISGWRWEQDIRNVVNRARENGFSLNDLHASEEQSVQALDENLPPPGRADAIEAAMRDAAAEVLRRHRDDGRLASSAREARERVVDVHDALVRGRLPRWNLWRVLEHGRYASLHDVARAHVRHPQLRLDLSAAIRAVFGVARRAMQRYADDKRAWGVLDFIDQEGFARTLLSRADLQERLREDIQLVLVDEFQDTSPLQLAVFTALSRIARRTVLVGDEKQAIYGFRGADPSLLHAVVSSVEDDRVSSLSISRRSRPALVHATSAVFARAFSRKGIDERRVRLQPHHDDEPPGLGPHVVRWVRRPPGEGMKAPPEEDVIAAGVVGVLQRGDVAVRVVRGEGIKPAQPRDIAVLARTNRMARDIAAALAVRGVPVQLRTSGLSSTLEARIVMAGLQLWLDGRDALAAASLVRVLRYADNPDAFVTDLLAAPPGTAFVDDDLVAGIARIAAQERGAGLVSAFDRVVGALRLPEVLAGFGDGDRRLADVAALRALAVRYVEECHAQGAGATIAGYLMRLDEMSHRPAWHEEDPDDERGELAGRDAVEVLTWHKAKGREWPIVVLAGLWSDTPPRPFGIFVERSVQLPSLQQPLEGRWLRYWPSPYEPRRGASSGETWRQHEGSGLHHTLRDSPLQQRALDEHARERLRLLYVGFTRARDRIVVVGDRDVWEAGTMASLVVDGRALCGEPAAGGVASWAGAPLQVHIEEPALRARLAPAVDERTAHAWPIDARPHVPAFVQPSAREGVGARGARVDLGGGLPVVAVRDRDDMNLLGRVVHAFLGVDAVGAPMPEVERARLAAELIARFDVARMVAVQDLVDVGDRLRAGLRVLVPDGALDVRTEVPILHATSMGSVARGQIDLLVRSDDGALVVDHKTTLDEEAEGYAGQLAAYAAAVEAATGQPVTATWIHFPVAGSLVQVFTTTP